MKRQMSNLEETLWLQMTAAGIAGRCVRELAFAKPRKFRFDFAFPHKMLAIEAEGAIWRGGRHTRGLGFMRDCEKQNLAVEMGWRCLRYTMAEIKSGIALAQIERVLNQ